MKILIVRLSAMGDTIHTLPVAAAFKRNLPDVEISWLVEPLSEPLLRNNPAIDKVFVLHKKAWLSASITEPGGIFQNIKDAWKLVQQLRAENFDIALDLQGLFKSAVFLSLSGAKRRIGLSDTREGAQLFTNEVVEVGDWFAPDVHIVERSLKVADKVIQSLLDKEGNTSHTNVVEFPLPAPPAESLQFAERLFEHVAIAEHQNTNKGMVRNVVLIPGATWATKLWASERWCDLVTQLSEKSNNQIFLIGTSLESDTNAFIEYRIKTSAPQVRVNNLTGQTGLLDLVALFQRADLVIGADTGPLHLAAATGHPKVLGVYGSSPRVRNGPYGTQCHTVALDLWCQPCSQKQCPLGTIDCLKQLSVDTVLKAIETADLAQLR